VGFEIASARANAPFKAYSFLYVPPSLTFKNST